MCEPKDLVVMVVDPDKESMKATCDSLSKCGITKTVCTRTYIDAIETIKNCRDDIDIVIADFDIEAGRSLGLLLCGAMKKEHPGIYFILISKIFSGSIIINSLPIADDILKKTDDVSEHVEKWINLAAYRNSVKELFHGKGNRKLQT